MNVTASGPASAPRRTLASRLFGLPIVMGLALVEVLFFLTNPEPGLVRSVGDPDIWWHLRNTAQWLHTGHFIRSDSWTFTVAGKPWIDPEWLAELPYYFAWHWLGERGIYLAMMLLAAAILLGVYLLGRLRSGSWTAAFVGAAVAAFFSSVSLAPRTLLVGWLFLILELGILWSLDRGRDHTLWLPPLFLLWVNAHGSWFIGFVLMGVFFACGWFAGEKGSLCAKPWSPAQRRKFVAVTAASAAVLFVNPYGWRLVAYPVEAIFRHKLGTEYIAEWASLDFHSALGKSVLVVFLGIALLQLLRRARWSAQDLAFALIAVYGAVTYVRFVFMAGILLGPLLARLVAGCLTGKSEPTKGQQLVNAVGLVVLLVLIAMRYPAARQLRAGFDDDFPAQALPYVRTLAGQGHLFNEYRWGGYLEWNAPQVKEFIDPRMDIFAESGILDDYARAIHVEDTFAVLDKYQIRYALLDRKTAMAYLLAHSPGWKVAYQDNLAVVFERAR